MNLFATTLGVREPRKNSRYAEYGARACTAKRYEARAAGVLQPRSAFRLVSRRKVMLGQILYNFLERIVKIGHIMRHVVI